MLTGVLLIVTIVTSCLAAWSDLKSLKIPNIYPMIIAASFALAYVLSPDSFAIWWQHALAGFVMLFVTFLMFAFGVMGGGDSKFAAALALWVGWVHVWQFVFLMALVGGFLGVFALWVRKANPFKTPVDGGWVAALQNGRNAVAYGIAICIGGIWTLCLSGVLQENIQAVFSFFTMT